MSAKGPTSLCYSFRSARLAKPRSLVVLSSNRGMRSGSGCTTTLQVTWRIATLVRLAAGNAQDSSFISGGFSNWKDATRCFTNHEKTATHKKAVEVMITLPRTTGDVGEMLSSTLASERSKNRCYLWKVAECIKFLARQGISFRGDGDERDSNFIQLLNLHLADDAQLQSCMERRRDKYTSPQVQNELIKVMAVNVLRNIATSIQKAKFYSVMADEVTDASNKEQVIVCFRTVDENFEVHEDFVGIHAVESIKADILVQVLKDTMLRMNLRLCDCHGQCYDGAKNMAGARKGVASQIRHEEPRATFLHCFGHALNLAAGDTVKKNKTLRDTLDITLELSKLLKYSPRRDAIFERLKSEIAPGIPGFRTLCPTRWTVRALSLESVLNNYAVFQALWEESIEIAADSETHARLIGVKTTMDTFRYFFGLVLGARILKHTDNLSKTLQNPQLTASEGQEVAELTCKTLESIRTEKAFDLFWTNVMQLREEKGVDEPVLPRKRKVPARFEEGSAVGHHPDTPQDLYRRDYFECLDLIVACIRDRFDQPGYRILKNLENLLLKATRSEDYDSELEFVLDYYKDDLQPSILRTQLELLASTFTEQTPTLKEIWDHFKDLSLAQRDIMSEVCVVIKLLMVMPATNAVSERSASGVRRIKTYLRSTMSQLRFNNLLVLHVHKDRADQLNLKTCLNEFVSGSDHRIHLFGSF